MRPNDDIGKTVAVEIDRPLGSRHPAHGFIYPVNHGFVSETQASYGDELDAYVLGVFEPVAEFEGRSIAVIHRLNDGDDKLVLIPEGRQLSDDQIRAQTEFQERFFRSEILRSGSVRHKESGSVQGADG